MRSCIFGVILVVSSASIFSGQTKTNKEVAINATLCKCAIKACCLCCGVVKIDAITLTLTGPDEKQMEILIKSDGTGPKFVVGGGPEYTDRVTVDKENKPLRCSPAGSVYKFDVFGGSKRGTYNIIVRPVGSSSETTICGHLCVIGQNNSALIRQGFSPDADAARKAAGVGADWTFNGAGCASNAPHPYDKIQATKTLVYTGVVGTQVAGGPFSGAGDSQMGTKEYPCSEVQQWCHGSNFNYCFKDDCDDKWIKVAECVVVGGDNYFKTRFDKCDNEDEPVFFELYNIDPQEKTGGTYRFTYWTYDRCKDKRTSIRVSGSKHRYPWEDNKDEIKGRTLEHTSIDYQPGLTGGVTADSQPRKPGKSDVNGSSTGADKECDE